MQPDIPLTRDLVLVGGGHTHALVLRMWAMRPLPGVRLTVINPGPTAPYSGMLPGHIAGHYSRDQLDIDLVQLARAAGARLILGRACGLDRGAKQVLLQGQPPVGYDVASIDIGITAEMPQMPGFQQHAVPVKPLDRYAEAWQLFLADVAAGRRPPSVAVIGGGIAGAELAMAMAHALRGLGADPHITVFERGQALAGVPRRTSRHLQMEMTAQGVQLRVGSGVAQVVAGAVQLPDGSQHSAGFILGAAGAVPHPWVASTDLPQTDGFISVDTHLQVVGDTSVFAVGDCASIQGHPRPKAGVFAVRAAPFLFQNLRAALGAGRMRRFVPQRDYLKLVSLGGKRALAEKLGVALKGRWLWAWKNRIDTRFMAQLSDMPAMAHAAAPADMAQGVAEMLQEKPLCGGCGAKVGHGVLGQALAGLHQPPRADVLAGPGDDAAVLRVGGETQVLTTDHLRAFVHDPRQMAQITAVHALGDIWAMGARPQAVLAQIVLPRMAPALQARSLTEIMQAAGAIFAGEGAQIVGGHTTMGAELTIGFSITGLMPQGQPALTIAGAQAGDMLLLTRPIGTGTILAAHMQGAAPGRDVAQMLAEMAQPQGQAAALLRPVAHAMTDVTGFGLAGHLGQICRASGVSAQLRLGQIPFYHGAVALAVAGHHSALMQANMAAMPVFGPDGPHTRLLYDPQTAGGLLAAVPQPHADRVLAALQQAGIGAAIIGQLSDGPVSISLQ